MRKPRKHLPYAAILILLSVLLQAGCLHGSGSLSGSSAPVSENEIRYEGSYPSEFLADPLPQPDGMTKYAENNKLSLYASPDTGDFMVRDKTSGKDWYSNPSPDTEVDSSISGSAKFRLFSQLLIYCVALDEQGNNVVQEEMSVSRTGSVIQGGLTVSQADNGVLLTYSFPMNEVTVPMTVVLNRDGISVAVDSTKIIQNGAQKVLWLSLAPYFCSGGPGDEGYMVVPDGSGALIRFNSDKGSYMPYHELVYGTDPAYLGETRPPVKNPVRLPVFGIRKNDAACVGIITRGDASASIDAQTAWMFNEWNNVYASFSIYGMDNVIIGQSTEGSARNVLKYDFRHRLCDTAEVRYILLDKDKADYADMAQKYKEYLEAGQDQTETSPSVDTPFFVNLFGGMVKKESFLGFLMKRYKPATTFSQSDEIIQTLKDEGIGHIVFSYSNWTSDEANAMFPNKMRPASRLGGAAGIRKLSGDMQSAGVEFFPSFDPYIATKSGHGFYRFFDSARKISGQPILVNTYSLARLIRRNKPSVILPLPDQIPDDTANFLAGSSRLGITGIYYPTLANVLYTNFSSDRFISRQSAKNWIIVALKEGMADSLADYANAYALPYLKYITDLPACSSGQDILDEDIPFYQLAVSGLVQYSTPCINIGQDMDEMKLFAIETGSGLYFKWAYENPEMFMESDYDFLYGANFFSWLNDAVQADREVQKAFEDAGSSTFVHHETIAEGISLSTFGNGSQIAVNHTAEPYQYGETQIPAKGWAVVKHGGDQDG